MISIFMLLTWFRCGSLLTGQVIRPTRQYLRKRYRFSYDPSNNCRNDFLLFRCAIILETEFHHPCESTDYNRYESCLLNNIYPFMKLTIRSTAKMATSLPSNEEICILFDQSEFLKKEIARTFLDGRNTTMDLRKLQLVPDTDDHRPARWDNCWMVRKPFPADENHPLYLNVAEDSSV